MEDKKRFDHPSYGTVRVSRVTSSEDRALYGSSIKHREAIQIQFRKSHLTRDLSSNFPHSDELLLVVELSPVQWAEMVSGIDSTSIPCTLRYTTTDGRIEECPYLDTRAAFNEDFERAVQDATENMQSAIDAARELLSKPTLKKAEREEVLQSLHAAQNAMSDAIPFVSRQFSEQLDRTVVEAKGEFDGFQARRMQELALAAMAAGQKLDEWQEGPPLELGLEPAPEPGIDLRQVAHDIASSQERYGFNETGGSAWDIKCGVNESGEVMRRYVEVSKTRWKHTYVVAHYSVCCHYENGDIDFAHTETLDVDELEQVLREFAASELDTEGQSDA